MLEQWLLTSFASAGLTILSTVAIFVVIVTLTRIAGLRSFSKMSGFDFAMTIAVGSVIADTLVSKDPPLLQGAVALVAIFALQKVVNNLRQFDGFRQTIDNEPLLLMKNGKVLNENLRRSNVTLDDLRSKLRESNVLERSQVRAVVFEPTGDLSVLHSSDASVDLESWLLDDVMDAPDAGDDPLQEG